MPPESLPLEQFSVAEAMTDDEEDLVPSPTAAVLGCGVRLSTVVYIALILTTIPCSVLFSCNLLDFKDREPSDDFHWAAFYGVVNIVYASMFFAAMLAAIGVHIDREWLIVPVIVEQIILTGFTFFFVLATAITSLSTYFDRRCNIVKLLDVEVRVGTALRIAWATINVAFDVLFILCFKRIHSGRPPRIQIDASSKKTSMEVRVIVP